MSVVMRMEMPKGCGYCPIANFGYCSINHKQVGDPFMGYPENRPANCPIICQLPEGHGRLVDAEEMYKKSEAFCNQCRQGDHDCEKCNYIVAQGYMYKSPTIVPAAAERSETCLD